MRVYDTARWRSLRREKLASTPRCECCGKRASHVDHIRSLASGGDPWAMNNIRSLCHGCHSSKTNRADGGGGNPKRKAWGCDVHGRPLDPDHWWGGK